MLKPRQLRHLHPRARTRRRVCVDVVWTPSHQPRSKAITEARWWAGLGKLLCSDRRGPPQKSTVTRSRTRRQSCAIPRVSWVGMAPAGVSALHTRAPRCTGLWSHATKLVSFMPSSNGAASERPRIDWLSWAGTFPTEHTNWKTTEVAAQHSNSSFSLNAKLNACWTQESRNNKQRALFLAVWRHTSRTWTGEQDRLVPP